MRYHSLVVQDGTLPSCLKVTARDERSNLIMAMEHQSLPIYGVQFHPESIGTPEGKSILRNFIALC
jgi:anthranilate synthase component II